MTKRFFIRTAQILRAARLSNALDDVSLGMIAGAFADEFEKANPRFDREKFLAAARSPVTTRDRPATGGLRGATGHRQETRRGGTA